MGSADRNLPEFIAVGPPRTATTWLHEVLKAHVSLPEGVKETHFFGWNFSRGIDWYKSHFQNPIAGKPIGEICPAYFDRPEARERIAKYIPACKIICTLRDPVQRLYSNYRQLRCEGWVGRVTLQEAMALHRKWSGPGNLFGASSYSAFLKEWQRRFGRDNVLVLLNDDLDQDPQEYLDRVCAFLFIPSIQVRNSAVRDQRVNAHARRPRSAALAVGGRKLREVLRRYRLYRLSEGFAPLWNFCSDGGERFPPLDPDTGKQLRVYFRPEVEALEKILERDLTAWK